MATLCTVLVEHVQDAARLWWSPVLCCERKPTVEIDSCGNTFESSPPVDLKVAFPSLRLGGRLEVLLRSLVN